MVTLVERVEGDRRGRGHLLVLTLLLLYGLHVGGRLLLTGVDELRRCATDDSRLTAMLSLGLGAIMVPTKV